MDLLRKKDINTSLDTECPFVKCLSALDLTLLGIGAIIGAGIFVLTGVVAATQTGPAIIYSYILAGLACAFSALSYAELAAMIGGCGSAYGYAYAGFGEIFAWIVGWDLLLEYSISVSAVSVGWSGYAKDILRAMHFEISRIWVTSPLNGGIMNVPALFIIVALTLLLCFGIKASKRFNNLMVLIKLCVIALFIAVASVEFNSKNWIPFNPFGWQGVIDGASLIFFAYIGFDAVSTAAEEAKNPQKDLPIGIIASLLVCTVLYMIVAGLLTGIVPYPQLNVASPISHAMILLGHRIVAGTIAVGAVAGLTTVMLVLFYGLSRVFFAMARDGLLPVYFAETHPETKTPLRIIILCGLLIGTMSALVPIDDLAELVNIGTLFAFIIVCSGVIFLRYTYPDMHRPFKVPFMPYVPAFGIICCLYLIYHLPFNTLIRFLLWMAAGIGIYFFYGRNKSHLARAGSELDAEN